MTTEELDIDAINQFLTDIGDAAPELINFFISESRAKIIRMGQLTADKRLARPGCRSPYSKKRRQNLWSYSLRGRRRSTRTGFPIRPAQ
jgi:hypothetical protein